MLVVSHKLIKQRRLKDSLDGESNKEYYFEQFMKSPEKEDRIPTEEEIRTQYRFRLPIIVA